MANVKTNLETLADQINLVEGMIFIANNKESKTMAFLGVNIPVLENILSSLRMVQSWVNLPEYHQAALQILDNAHEVNAGLQKGGDGSMSLLDFMDDIYLVTQRSASGQEESAVAMMRIASLALIAVAKFIVPTSQVKEVNNGV